MSTTATYPVAGMSCQHCVDAVSAEVGKLPGVTQVDIDLGAGTVSFTSDEPVPVEAVRAAVDEAGYDLGAPEG